MWLGKIGIAIAIIVAIILSCIACCWSALDHATEELEDLRGWLKSFGRQREKLSRMGAELRYASWRERNSATLGREVFGQLHEIRSGLRSRRRELLVAEEMARAQEAEADEAAADKAAPARTRSCQSPWAPRRSQSCTNASLRWVDSASMNG